MVPLCIHHLCEYVTMFLVKENLIKLLTSCSTVISTKRPPVAFGCDSTGMGTGARGPRRVSEHVPPRVRAGHAEDQACTVFLVPRKESVHFWEKEIFPPSSRALEFLK